MYSQCEFYLLKVDNINDYPKIIYSIKYYFSKHIKVEKISLSKSKYTTFQKFVKLGFYEENWCNFEDKNKISDLDFE